MSISVILPNYNHAQWLPCALEALAQQRPQPSEIIVVDDASTDNSVAVIKEFQKRYSFVKFIQHDVNKGAEAAVKTALQHVSSELLLFAAADDFVLPGLLARALPAMEKNPGAAFFCSEVVLIDQTSNIIGFRPFMIPRSTAAYISPEKVRRTIRNSDNWFIGASVIYRRDRLAEIGFFDSSLATLQDAMATRLLAFRYGFYFEPEVLAAWRVIPGSLSVRSSQSIQDNKNLLSRAEAWIDANFPEDIAAGYRRLFDRRLRFNFARAKLVWRQGSIDSNALIDILNWNKFDLMIVRLAEHFPRLADSVILAWMTLRCRPYGMNKLLASIWRNSTVNRRRRAVLALELRRCGNPAAQARTLLG